MGGLVFVVIGIIIGLVAKSGEYLSAHGAAEYAQTMKEWIKEEITSEIPISISWDD